MFCLLGCTTSTVQVRVQKAPEVALPNVKRVAVIGVQTLQGPNNLGPMIAEELVSSLSMNNFFTVVERQQIWAIINEQEFSRTGMVTPQQRIRLQQLYSVNALIAGSITQAKCQDSGQWITADVFSGGKHYKTKAYEAMREAKLEVAFRIIDTATGSILAARSNNGIGRSLIRDENMYNAQINLEECNSMLYSIKSEVVQQFIQQISPHEILETRTIYRGESEKMLEANEYFRAGLVHEAGKIWMEITRMPNHPEAHLAYFNYAIYSEMNDDFKTANEYFIKAYALGQEVDFKVRCQQEAARTQQRQVEEMRLKSLIESRTPVPAPAPVPPFAPAKPQPTPKKKR